MELFVYYLFWKIQFFWLLCFIKGWDIWMGIGKGVIGGFRGQFGGNLEKLLLIYYGRGKEEELIGLDIIGEMSGFEKDQKGAKEGD